MSFGRFFNYFFSPVPGNYLLKPIKEKEVNLKHKSSALTLVGHSIH